MNLDRFEQGLPDIQCFGWCCQCYEGIEDETQAFLGICKGCDEVNQEVHESLDELFSEFEEE